MRFLSFLSALSLTVFIALPAQAEPCTGFMQTMGDIERILDEREDAQRTQEMSQERYEELTMATRSVRADAFSIEGGTFANESVKVFPLGDALHFETIEPASGGSSENVRDWALRELARQTGISKAGKKQAKGSTILPSYRPSGYQPRQYASQYKMPRTGNRSRPEEATQY